MSCKMPSITNHFLNQGNTEGAGKEGACPGTGKESRLIPFGLWMHRAIHLKTQIRKLRGPSESPQVPMVWNRGVGGERIKVNRKHYCVEPGLV